MNWISIKEELPPLDTDIIVLGKNPYLGYRGEPARLWHVNLSKTYKPKALKMFLRLYEITHYLIIPQIPN